MLQVLDRFFTVCEAACHLMFAGWVFLIRAEQLRLSSRNMQPRSSE
jgi:hypothetical protein